MKNYGFHKTTLEKADFFCYNNCPPKGTLCPFRDIDGEYCPELLVLLRCYDTCYRVIKGLLNDV